MNFVSPSRNALAGQPKPPSVIQHWNPETVYAELVRCLLGAVGKDPAAASGRDWFLATASLVRQVLAGRWVESGCRQDDWRSKRVYYLSMEFLLGRLLTDSLRNLGLYDVCRTALARAGHDIEAVVAHEADPALGNGGLGRLAACLMDSMATLGIPAYGYGIRFEYGLFRQKIDDGWQVEKPDHWLRYGNPWEFPRPDILYAVPFCGAVSPTAADPGCATPTWTGTEDVFALAYDVPVCGFDSQCVNTLRLWSAKAPSEFDTKRFNGGDHFRALEQRTFCENLSRVLYPGDSTDTGRELRFRQEYFFVSASIQDIIAQYQRAHDSFDALPDKVAIQINDTHPALVVPELLRLLMDRHGLVWEKALDIARQVVGYTSHTLMPEALETWPVHYFERMLPRHLQIIYRINAEFLDGIRRCHANATELVERLSLIDERGGRQVRMANLAFVGSHKVNGVSRMHTDLMKDTVFADFDRVLPGRIVNVTNGVTPRRWLVAANPDLANLIDGRLGTNWYGRLDELAGLAHLVEDPDFRQRFRAVKQANKERLAHHVARSCGVSVNPDSLFDVHVKRIHEYKRQTLKLLHAVTLYRRIRSGRDSVTRTIVFAGKAAPGYAMAKLIVKLIHDVAGVINGDPMVGNRLKVLFLPDYGVSEAEIIIPAADLSEQISTAGTEASGTGNMKLALNGALTVGTLDGANVEIADAVGHENFFAFGHTVQEAQQLRDNGYSGHSSYETDDDLRDAIDMIASGAFSRGEPGRFRPLIESWLGSDHFLVLADFPSYLACQDRLEALYRDAERWTRHAISNVAGMGVMSSDRAVAEYAELVWNVRPSRPQEPPSAISG